MSLAQTPNALEHDLLKRAQKLGEVRAYFAQQNVFEVDCSILSDATNIDDHIDPLEVSYFGQKGFLHTSPELHLKKLLAQTSQDLYFLGHVFRDFEKGPHHQVEFTMIEWYRRDFSFQEMIEDTLGLISLFIPNQEASVYSYHELFKDKTSLCATSATKSELLAFIQSNLNIHSDLTSEDASDLVSLIFSEFVEPSFKDEPLVVIKDFPQKQAALAQVVTREGLKVAKRFEVYSKGVELANGYQELKGSSELLKRYETLNQKRVRRGKNKLPIDQDFIRANGKLPDCCGVAVGFDRLMMLYLDKRSI